MLKIRRIQVTPFGQNARIAYDDDTRRGVVVDPGGEARRVLEVLAELKVHADEIWLTHSHLDHCGGVAGLRRELAAVKLRAHRAGEPLRTSVADYASVFGLPPGLMENCPEPDAYFQDGDLLSVGGKHAFKVLHTPGHSPDSVSFYSAEEALVFTGDTLMAGGIGRTDLPGGDYGALMHSLHKVLLTLPPRTQVLAGHGEDSVLEEEIKNNPFLQE